MLETEEQRKEGSPVATGTALAVRETGVNPFADDVDAEPSEPLAESEGEEEIWPVDDLLPTLNSKERARLKELELQILDHTNLIGEALLEISEGKLYREQYPTFEEYAWAQWGIRRSTAYNLMNAVRVSRQIAPVKLTRSQCVLLASEPEDSWSELAPELVGLTTTATTELLSGKKADEDQRGAPPRVIRLLKQALAQLDDPKALAASTTDEEVHELTRLTAAIHGRVECVIGLRENPQEDEEPAA